MADFDDKTDNWVAKEIASLVPGLENGMLYSEAFRLILKELKRLKEFEPKVTNG